MIIFTQLILNLYIGDYPILFQIKKRLKEHFSFNLFFIYFLYSGQIGVVNTIEQPEEYRLVSGHPIPCTLKHGSIEYEGKHVPVKLDSPAGQ